MLVDDQIRFLEAEAVQCKDKEKALKFLAIVRQLRAGKRLFRDCDREVIMRKGYIGVHRAREQWMEEQTK